MNADELASLRRFTPTIDAAELEGDDRTLLYGYDANRFDWHVYLEDGLIHRVIYTVNGLGRPSVISHESAASWPAEELWPGKRAYPESTDYEFAKRLIAVEVHISFLPFDEARYDHVKDQAFHAHR